MILPRKPVPGEPVTAQLVGRMIDYMRRITPLRGPNVLLQSTPGGTIIGAVTPPNGAASDVGPYPFWVRELRVPESGGSGESEPTWCIYLPANCLYVETVAVDATTGLDAAGGNLAGWYVLPEFSGEDGGPVYLHVTLPYVEDLVSHGPQAEIVTGRAPSGGGDGGGDGGEDFYIEVAVAGPDGVTQQVVGTLVVGGAAPVPDKISVDYAGGGEDAGGGDGGGGGSEAPAHLLQIKDWDNDESNDSNNLSALMTPVDGAPPTENEDYELVVRKGGKGQLLRYLKFGVLPAAALPNTNVVTGVSFAFDTQTNQLVATLTKANLKTNAVSTVPVAIPLWKQDVDSGSAYSPSSHKYTKVVMPSVRTVNPAPGASSSDVTTVFTSTPLSAE